MLEGREEFNPSGMPEGSWEVRLRDIDSLSPSYGAILRGIVSPIGAQGYDLRYELRPAPKVAKSQIVSPLARPISQINPDLRDLGSAVSVFPEPVTISEGNLSSSQSNTDHHFEIKKPSTMALLDSNFSKIQETIRHPEFAKFLSNLDAYEEFGDFGAKPTHPGTNLVGPNGVAAATV